MQISGSSGWDTWKWFYLNKNCECRTRMRWRAAWNCDHYLKFILSMDQEDQSFLDESECHVRQLIGKVSEQLWFLPLSALASFVFSGTSFRFPFESATPRFKSLNTPEKLLFYFAASVLSYLTPLLLFHVMFILHWTFFVFSWIVVKVSNLWSLGFLSSPPLFFS